MKHALKQSGKLIFHPFTNCSPFAVVSVLGFLECLHEGDSIATIAHKFSTKQVSMLRYLETHLPGHRPRLTQVALYLQGMKYSQAANRFNLPSFDPVAIKQSVQEEYLSLIRRQQAVQRLEAKGASERTAKRLLVAETQFIVHTRIKLFSKAEVDLMNEGIISEVDKYHINDAGLMLHHCCCPDCPYYLLNLMSTSDRKLVAANTPIHQWSRRGLMRHLSADLLTDNYVPSLHLVGHHLARTSTEIEAFQNAMNTSFRDNKRYASYRMREERLHEMYQFSPIVP